MGSFKRVSRAEGRGTAYERAAVADLLQRLQRRWGWRRSLELPANGVLGLPGLKSVALARTGVVTTVAHPEGSLLERAEAAWRLMGLGGRFVAAPPHAVPLESSSFDLVWSFCAFEHLQHPRRGTAEMVRLSRRHVLIFIQNALLPGPWLHRLTHWRTGEEWDHGDTGRMDLPAVRSALVQAAATNGRSLRVIETGGADLPPWPDINMMLSDLLPSLLLGRPHSSPRTRTSSTAEVAACAEVELPTLLSLWHLLAERSCPGPLSALLAHHPYLLVELASP